jgi:hypothetical protein
VACYFRVARIMAIADLGAAPSVCFYGSSKPLERGKVARSTPHDRQRVDQLPFH